jgi:hypothetical protein
VFERTVTVLRDAGRTTESLRQVTWSGRERGDTLAIGVGEEVGDTLLLRIDNGDNPPLPIESIRVTSPRVEVRARIPDGGARLVYGAPGEQAPDYDLSLLQDEVSRMPVADATLGPEASLAPPEIGLVDRALTLFGVAVLALGLLGMLVQVLRGVPAASGPVAGPPGAK